MEKIILKNKEANFNYEAIAKYSAGIELLGWEVKSIRLKNVNFKGSFCVFKGNELFVINMHISKYMNVSGEETRTRKLLLNANELKKIKFLQVTQGLTIIPQTLVLSSRGLIKLKIIIGKGKTKYDKRQTIKERDQKRMIKKFY